MKTRKLKATKQDDGQLVMGQMWTDDGAEGDNDSTIEEVVTSAEPVPVREEDATDCPECGGALVFDPYVTGDTCGGVSRAGWLICQACGNGWLSSRGVSADVWKVTGGGHSVDACGMRIRAEGGEGRALLMRRIARVPALEDALRRIARGDDDAREIAKEALENINE